MILAFRLELLSDRRLSQRCRYGVRVSVSSFRPAVDQERLRNAYYRHARGLAGAHEPFATQFIKEGCNDWCS